MIYVTCSQTSVSSISYYYLQFIRHKIGAQSSQNTIRRQVRVVSIIFKLNVFVPKVQFIFNLSASNLTNKRFSVCIDKIQYPGSPLQVVNTNFSLTTRNQLTVSTRKSPRWTRRSPRTPAMCQDNSINCEAKSAEHSLNLQRINMCKILRCIPMP